MAQPWGHWCPSSKGLGTASSGGTSGVGCAVASGAGRGCERWGGVPEWYLLRKVSDTDDKKVSTS